MRAPVVLCELRRSGVSGLLLALAPIGAEAARARRSFVRPRCRRRRRVQLCALALSPPRKAQTDKPTPTRPLTPEPPHKTPRSRARLASPHSHDHSPPTPAKPPRPTPLPARPRRARPPSFLDTMADAVVSQELTFRCEDDRQRLAVLAADTAEAHARAAPPAALLREGGWGGGSSRRPRLPRSALACPLPLASPAAPQRDLRPPARRPIHARGAGASAVRRLVSSTRLTPREGERERARDFARERTTQAAARTTRTNALQPHSPAEQAAPGADHHPQPVHLAHRLQGA